MHGINKTVVAALISSSLLMGCNSDDYDEPQTSSGYELSEYGTPELCGNDQEWASAEQVTAIENLVEL
ncbi:hypothetical protein, partial [Vibrio harveyi]